MPQQQRHPSPADTLDLSTIAGELDLTGISEVAGQLDLSGLEEPASSGFGDVLKRYLGTVATDIATMVPATAVSLLSGPGTAAVEMGKRLGVQLATGQTGEVGVDVAEAVTGAPLRQMASDYTAKRYPELAGHTTTALLALAAPKGIRMARARLVKPPAPQPARVAGLLSGDVRPSFVATPEGVVGTPEAIPMQPAPDGSFQRVVPAQPMAFRPDGSPIFSSDPTATAATPPPRVIRGRLASRAESLEEFVPTDAGTVARRRDVIDALDLSGLENAPAPPRVTQERGPRAVPARVMDFDAQGQPIFSSDPDAVSVSRPVRGALPEQAQSLDEFVPTAGGQVARRREMLDQPDVMAALDATGVVDETATAVPVVSKRGRKAKAAQERMAVPAAPMDFDLAGKPIFSSDPNAIPAKAVPLSPAERVELQAMYQEMVNMPFTRHSFVEVPGRGSSLEIVPGGRGADVYQDIASVYGREPGRGAVIDAIEKTLAGEPSTYGPALREVARLRRSGFYRRQLPPDAGVRNPLLKGDLGDEDFKGFSEFIDDLSIVDEDARHVGGGREPGEEGAINPAVLGALGGGAAGAAAGGLVGDTAEERLRNAALGGLLGAGALVGGQRAIRMKGARVVPQQPPASRIVGVAPPQQGTRITGMVAADGVTIPTTGRKPPTPGTPLADPLRGVDVFLEKFAPEIREGIKQVIDQNGGFQAQRRGAITQPDVDRLAEAVAVDVRRTVKAGTALNAEAIRAHVNSLATAQSKVNELAAKVARGQNTDADVLALEAARAEVNTLTASVMGARSEAGRALAQWRVLARVLATGNPGLMAEAADVLRGDAARFAREFAQQPPDAVGRYRWLQQQNQLGLRDKVRQFYLANILSGLKTHERNILGNLANVLTNLGVHPAAAGVDALRARFTGQPRTVTLAEFPSQLVGAAAGIERGIAEALFSLRHGVNRSALTQSLSAAEAGKLDVPRVEFGPARIAGVKVVGGGGANPLNWPGRALDAADQFFRAIARNMEAHGLAHAQAKREGLTGDAFETRMAELLAGGGGEAGQRIAEQADAFARRTVFQEKAGPLVGLLQAAVKKVPELSFVMPFIRTPANILRQGFEFSPAGFAMQGARAGGRVGAQAQARAALGSMGLAGLAWLAATGRLSGNGPNDRIERAQLMESGWRPNSVRIGDQWVEIALFQPVSVPAMAIANAFESWREGGMREQDAPTKAFEAARGFGQSVLDLSFLSGLADLFAALSREGSAGSKAASFAGRVASGFVPLSGAQRTVTQGLDPMVRDADGFTEQVMTGLPGLSDDVPARLDRFGQEIARPGGALRRAADPFNVSPVNADPVLAELGRLGIRMGFPSDRITGLDLSREQERQVHQVKGQSTYAALERLIQSSRYQRLSDAQKAEAIERVIDRTRSAAGKVMKRKLQGRAQPQYSVPVGQ